MACGSQAPFPASGVRGSCTVNGVWGNRALSANSLNKRYITSGRQTLTKTHSLRKLKA